MLLRSLAEIEIEKYDISSVVDSEVEKMDKMEMCTGQLIISTWVGVITKDLQTQMNKLPGTKTERDMKEVCMQRNKHQ